LEEERSGTMGKITIGLAIGFMANSILILTFVVSRAFGA
jgi:preprotein translocase subunit SecG